jgi:hypothetical protein
MPRASSRHAPRADTFALSGSVGLGAGNEPDDVAHLQRAMIAAGALPPNPRNLLYDPHDGRFLDAVLTLQEKLGVRPSGVIRAGGPELRLLAAKAAANGGSPTPARPGGASPATASDRYRGASSGYAGSGGAGEATHRYVPEAWVTEPEGGPATPPAPTQPGVGLANALSPARVAVARAIRIGLEERRKREGRHNDLEDAMRHAEWNRRMTEELGPSMPGWSLPATRRLACCRPAFVGMNSAWTYTTMLLAGRRARRGSRSTQPG